MTRHPTDRRPAPSHRRADSRRGALLVVALIAMLVVMAILGAMLRGTLLVMRHQRTQQDVRQTELLLQGGADRAALRLHTEAAYRGETWNLPADEIVGRGAGQVTIAASRDTDAAAWRVHVVAEYPIGGPSSICRSRTFFVQPQSPLVQE